MNISLDFLQKNSTVHQLIEIYNCILNALEKKKSAVLYSVTFQRLSIKFHTKGYYLKCHVLSCSCSRDCRVYRLSLMSGISAFFSFPLFSGYPNILQTCDMNFQRMQMHSKFAAFTGFCHRRLTFFIFQALNLHDMKIQIIQQFSITLLECICSHLHVFLSYTCEINKTYDCR